MARTGTNTGTPQEPPKRLPEGPVLQSSSLFSSSCQSAVRGACIPRILSSSPQSLSWDRLSCERVRCVLAIRFLSFFSVVKRNKFRHSARPRASRYLTPARQMSPRHSHKAAAFTAPRHDLQSNGSERQPRDVAPPDALARRVQVLLAPWAFPSDANALRGSDHHDGPRLGPSYAPHARLRLGGIRAHGEG